MKKCLVLDLDNTLWGGIVGEDGAHNLALSMSSPGNSFIAFQQAILDHYDRGIILAINSRNNKDEALSVIRTHPNMILKEHHFAAIRINWQDKATNIRELADELNIGLDSMVFIDDDITNRELVKALVPEVTVPDLPEDPTLYTKFLNSLPYFTSKVITDEDKMRGNLYVTERLRKEQEKQFSHKEDFLKELQLELFVFENNSSCVDRLAQLTEKTNQFNTCKIPLSKDKIESYILRNDYKIFHARLQDMFGDYGVIMFALVEIKGNSWYIRSMLMSCRVFGKGVEDAFLDYIIGRAQAETIEKLHIDFSETEKNIPAKEFVSKHFQDNTFTVKSNFTKPFWIKTTYENI
jgi:FkbH-like protein